MNKRILALFLTVLMVLALLPSAVVSAAESDILGVWKGSYGSSSHGRGAGGDRGLTLTVSEEDGRYVAVFEFYGLPGRTDYDEEGSYYMDVDYESAVGVYTLKGTKWIMNPGGYTYRSLTGKIDGNVFSGSDFELFKQGASERPASFLSDLMGVWEGSYGSGDSERGLTLTVKEIDEYPVITFEFFGLPGKSYDEEGSYYMYASYEAVSDIYSLNGVEWIQNPGGFSFVGLKGELDGNTFSGNTIAYGSDVFTLTREGGAPAQQTPTPATPTPATPTPVTPPSSGNAVGGFDGEGINVGSRLVWQPVRGALGYRLYRATNRSDEGISVTDFYITSNEYIDVNVKPSTTYYYRVRQVIAEAKPFEGLAEQLGPWSDYIEVKTPSANDFIGDDLVPPSPSAKKRFILMTLDDPYMSVDGVRMEIDPGRGTAPINNSGRTMVPIRAIAEAMGGSVGWNGSTSEVALSYAGKNVKMWLNQYQINANGATQEIDVPPASINGRTMLPIRFAAESLGCAIDWLNSTRQIVVVFY